MKKPWVITPDKFLSQEQVAALLIHLERERDAAITRGKFTPIKVHYMFRGLLESGARCFEFCALKNKDFVGQRLVIRNGKGNKPRTILLTKAGAACIKEWLSIKAQVNLSLDPEAPLFPSHRLKHYSTRGLRKIVKTVFATLQFPTQLSVHALRHTNASLLLEADTPLPRVRDNLGHSSLVVTDKYSHAIGELKCEDLLGAAGSAIYKKAAPEKDLISTKSKVLIALRLSTRSKRNQK